MTKKLSLLILVLVFIGILPVLVCNHGYFLMESDYFNQQIPFIYETKRMLSSGIPFWSWNHYFGDNFIGAYSFYTLTSPFVWINCLFPYKYLIWGIELTLFLKFLCCGWVSYAYFRQMRFAQRLSALGALMYTFSSYTITNLFYYHFMEPLICFPLLLMAIEHLLGKGRHRYSALIAASFLVVFVNFYFSIGSFVAAALYGLCRIVRGEAGEKGRTTCAAMACVIAGIAIAAVVLVPIFLYLNGSARDEAASLPSFKEYLYLIGYRAVYLFMPKLSEGPNPYLHVVNNWSGPAVALPVAGCFFTLVYVVKRKDWLSLLLGLCLLLYLTPLNGIFTLFTSVTYVRWGYAFCLFSILATLNVIDKGDYKSKDFKRYLLLSLAVIVAYYAANSVWFFKRHLSVGEFLDEVDWPFNLANLVLFAISLACLYSFVKTRKTKVLAWGIVVCVALQFSTSTGSRELSTCKSNEFLSVIDREHKVIFLDNSHPEESRPFTHRSDLVLGKYKNMSLLTDQPSVGSWSSCINKSISPLILSADTSKTSIRMQFAPTCNRTSFDALMSVKEIQIYYNDPLLATMKPAPIDGKRLKAHQPNVDIYAFDYYIPMGFTYDSYMDAREIYRLDTAKAVRMDIPLQLLAHLWVDSCDTAVAAKYMRRGTMTTHLSIDSVCRERRKQVCDRFEGDTHGFSAHVDMKKANLLFFSVPADPGFKATVDGKPTRILKANLGLSAIVVDKGRHHIRFEYTPEGLKAGAMISLLALLIALAVFVWERGEKQGPRNVGT